MKIFAISDLHLSFQKSEDGSAQVTRSKPMDLFGDHWNDYEAQIMQSWNLKVSDDDVGVIAGDISWAMKIAEAEADFEYLAKLKGTKIIVRGNHDYWFSSISKVRASLPSTVLALQNDSVKIGKYVFCGTRGWRVPERFGRVTEEDKKLLNREVIRFGMSLADAKKKMEDGDKLIAILHYPPFNSMRDDSEFTKLCEENDVSACIYGHLHGKNCRNEIEVTKGGIKYYLTSCDLLKHSVIEINV